MATLHGHTRPWPVSGLAEDRSAFAEPFPSIDQVVHKAQPF